MTILDYLVDAVTLGYKIIKTIINWAPAVLGLLVGMFENWYPYNLIVLTGGTVMVMKMILRGGK